MPSTHASHSLPAPPLRPPRSYVIVTNENPRLEYPARVVSDVVAGFPDDLVNRYAGFAYFPFQDQGRTPLWFEPYLQKAQRDNSRCGPAPRPLPAAHDCSTVVRPQARDLACCRARNLGPAGRNRNRNQYVNADSGMYSGGGVLSEPHGLGHKWSPYAPARGLQVVR